MLEGRQREFDVELLCVLIALPEQTLERRVTTQRQDVTQYIAFRRTSNRVTGSRYPNFISSEHLEIEAMTELKLFSALRLL